MIFDPYNWYAAFCPPEGEDDIVPGVPFRYKCMACDVAGTGLECWCCGTVDELIVGWSPSLANGANWYAQLIEAANAA